jgi:quercetin dioxygenase-like cupin family protein
MNRTDFIKSSALITAGVALSPKILALKKLSSQNKNNPVFISPQAGKEYQLPNMKITAKLSDKESNGEFEVLEEITDSGYGTPLHTHIKQWEILEVLEGKYKIKANEDIFIAEPGSIVIVPPNTPHCFLNIDSKPSKLRFMLSPGLNFEGFVKEMSELKEMPDIKSLGELLNKYSMELVGEPLKMNE